MGFTNSVNEPRFKKSIPLKDTIKKVDTIKIADTLAVEDAMHVKTELYQENALASYYANKFNGRRTASGSIFSNNKLTCAHRKLPFGTKLKVTSVKTGKFVFVTVTDRGPFTHGRHIDLSKKAFMQIAPSAYGGHIKVTIEIVKEK